MENNAHEYAKELAQSIAKVLDDKKAIDISTLTVEKQTALADFLVIATGTSSTHIRALVDEVEFKTRENMSVEPKRIEGMGNQEWILMDYGTVIVHVFTRQAREFYKLDKLWHDSGAEVTKSDTKD